MKWLLLLLHFHLLLPLVSATSSTSPPEDAEPLIWRYTGPSSLSSTTSSSSTPSPRHWEDEALMFLTEPLKADLTRLLFFTRPSLLLLSGDPWKVIMPSPFLLLLLLFPLSLSFYCNGLMVKEGKAWSGGEGGEGRRRRARRLHSHLLHLHLLLGVSSSSSSSSSTFGFSRRFIHLPPLAHPPPFAPLPLFLFFFKLPLPTVSNTILARWTTLLY